MSESINQEEMFFIQTGLEKGEIQPLPLMMPERYRFDYKDYLELRKSFMRMSTNGLMTQQEFAAQSGLLGVEGASYLCDRVFSVIDYDRDGHVRKRL